MTVDPLQVRLSGQFPVESVESLWINLQESERCFLNRRQRCHLYLNYSSTLREVPSVSPALGAGFGSTQTKQAIRKEVLFFEINGN